VIADDVSARAPGLSKLREIGFLSARKRDDPNSGESVVPQEFATLVDWATNASTDRLEMRPLGNWAP
jgi:hypothetical protein